MKLAVLPPKALNMREVYFQAMGELTTPPQTHKLPDWALFNRVTGGFRGREFSILCGSTGAGKTTFLANLSAQFVKSGVKHFVMSVETGHTDYMKRIMSVFAGVDVNTGDVIPLEIARRIHDNYGDVLTSELVEFSPYDNRLSCEQLIADLDYMHKIKGCRVAMIDNLNFFLDVTTVQNAVLEVDRVIHELIMFCKRTDMHVIMVMHPNKGGGSKDRSTRVESEYDIKGSSTAVQEAHNVFLFNRPRTDDLNRNPFDRELKFAKMRRRGAFVGRTIVFRNHNTRYDEVEIT